MKNEFLLAITQLAAERNLPRDMVFKVVEDALFSTYRKDKSLRQYDFSVSVLPASGEIKLQAYKTVVELPENDHCEISLAEARKIKSEVNIGDKVGVSLNPPDAGRIGVNVTKQVVMQRLHEAESEFIFGTFAHREGDILSGVVQRKDGHNITIDLGNAEGILPSSEQVRTEQYRTGQRLRLYLLEVSQSNKGPRIVLSRTHVNLVKRLFELEVPEISNGLVEVKAITRDPGSRAKLAVSATQQGIDAIGSCIGLRGIRIQNVINELQGERIDVVRWSPEPETFIANALSPSQVLEVTANPSEGAVAVVPDNQLSLAIGREGQNVRLAANLTGWRLDVKNSSAAEEEKAAREVEEAAIEETREEEPVEQEEVTPVKSVIGEEESISEGTEIRFAEDILPSREEEPKVEQREKEKGEKTKKKKARRMEKEEEFGDED